ncbi:MFS transporter [Tropicimonas sp. IMCC34043]|uniref:MFS transporter n=1 Tax=Tropicimonas sp. IMCC34043 TaxID=2248760 RepID=UPI001E4E3B2D|nr:MFS transporter [Tropicimonas sp. IMCC34043]
MPEAVLLAAPPDRDRLGLRTAVVAMFLASAGIPLYIHLPMFAAEIGLPLATVGIVLLGIRVMDFVQDPFLGWLAQRLPDRRGQLAALSLLALGGGLMWVFALQPGLFGFVLGLILVFTAYSLGMILFYSQCVANAAAGGDTEHYRLAGWRETGMLIGIVVAAILPQVGGDLLGARGGYVLLGAVALLAAPLVIRAGAPLWQGPVPVQTEVSYRQLLSGRARHLLVLSLVNALPVAVTATLFLFFVDDKLGLPDLAGVFLVMFFVAAGATAPLWSRLAAHFGPRRVLLVAMVLAIAAFGGTAMLPPGAAVAFGLITIASGAALGAEMVILPAFFSATLASADLPAALGFGAWNFANKFALALAAGILLPTLHLAGYTPGGANSAAVLALLTAAYALLPLFLKLPAIWLVLRLTDEV